MFFDEAIRDSAVMGTFPPGTTLETLRKTGWVRYTGLGSAPTWLAQATDGRPDELVRGVNLIGTPLEAFSKIVKAGQTLEVFNGSCGAESGWVPVSAVSPSLLLESVETQRQSTAQNTPPLLPPPLATGAGGTTSGEQQSTTQSTTDQRTGKPMQRQMGTDR